LSCFQERFEERVVQIRRVTKVVKGGKQLSFRAVVVVGNEKGTVGVGVASAKEVIMAVQVRPQNALGGGAGRRWRREGCARGVSLPLFAISRPLPPDLAARRLGRRG